MWDIHTLASITQDCAADIWSEEQKIYFLITWMVTMKAILSC